MVMVILLPLFLIFTGCELRDV